MDPALPPPPPPPAAVKPEPGHNGTGTAASGVAPTAGAGAGAGAGSGAGSAAGAGTETNIATGGAGNAPPPFARPPAVPKVPLPPKVQQAEQDVAANEYNSEAWRLLFDHAQGQPIEYARTVYERFLKVFPTAGRYWKFYAEHEERSGQHDRVADVLKRALVSTVNVDVFKFYVDYTRRTKLESLPPGAPAAQRTAARKLVADAYEVALEKVGLSLSSHELWESYLAFVSDAPESLHFEITSKGEALRSGYMRAVTTPNNKIEELWARYSTYEFTLNTGTAPQYIARVESAYKTARTAFFQLRALWSGITHAALAVPPTNTAKEALQGTKWRRLITFEKSNPLLLNDESKRERVRFVFQQCLDCLRFYPEIWLDFVDFEVSCGEVKRAGLLLERALEALPESRILHFAAADFHEEQGKDQRAMAVYERMLENMPSPLTFILYQSFSRRALGNPEGRKGAARKVFARARKLEKGVHCTHHVYTAAAMLEYHTNKDARAALNIFQLGMKSFADKPEFVLHYAEFLTWTNDNTNLRLLFEKVLKDMPPATAPAVWERFLEFELRQTAGGGSLKAVAAVEQRYLTAYADIEGFDKSGFGAPGAQRLHRYMAYGLAPGSKYDRRCLQRLSITPVDRLTGMSNGVPVGAAATRLGADVSRSAPRTRARVDAPPFLESLRAKLPTTFKGVAPNPDYVMQCISGMDIGPAPIRPVGGDPAAGATKRARPDGSFHQPPSSRRRTGRHSMDRDRRSMDRDRRSMDRDRRSMDRGRRSMDRDFRR